MSHKLPETTPKVSGRGLTVERSERRRFTRWEISIPCTMEWQGSSTKGQIANLSFGGALIKRVNAVPPKGTRVIVRFQVKKERVELQGRLTARIIHTIQELREGEGIISLGVQFEEPSQEVTSKLIPVLRALIGRAD